MTPLKTVETKCIKALDRAKKEGMRICRGMYWLNQPDLGLKQCCLVGAVNRTNAEKADNSYPRAAGKKLGLTLNEVQALERGFCGWGTGTEKTPRLQAVYEVGKKLGDAYLKPYSQT